jgi:hypothetical protein
LGIEPELKRGNFEFDAREDKKKIHIDHEEDEDGEESILVNVIIVKNAMDVIGKKHAGKIWIIEFQDKISDRNLIRNYFSDNQQLDEIEK